MFRPILTGVAVGAATLACLPAAAGAATSTEISNSANAGAGWLASQQKDAGNWTGYGANTTPSAMAAAGRNLADVSRPGKTNGQDYLFNTLTSAEQTAPTATTDDSGRVGVVEQSILQGYAAGLTPARIAANENLAAQLAAYYDNGYFASTPFVEFGGAADPSARSSNYVIFGTLALNRLSAPKFLVDRSVQAVRANRLDDGGWARKYVSTAADRAEDSSVDLTGAAIAALCESGVSPEDADVRAGAAFLQSKVIKTGGVAGSEGAFDGEYGADADSTGWAISGLNACGIDPQGPGFRGNGGRTPVDFLISLQQSSGGFFYNQGDPYGLGANVGASQDAVRALAGQAFSADPPARAGGTGPRTRPLPVVADGTTVPVALAVDNGSGGVRFCRVSVPSGSSLATLLATANDASSPGGCATGAEYTAGQVSKLNGQSGTWALSIDGGADQAAASQPVRFGDLVSLRRTGRGLPATPSGTGGSGNTGSSGDTGGGQGSASVPAAVQARTTPAGVASKSLKVSGKKRAVTVSLSCARANRLCQGSVYLVYGKRTLGQRAFLIGGGKTTKLTVSLSRSSLKRLGGKRRKIKVNTFSRDGAGVASTSSRTVTLTPSK